MFALNSEVRPKVTWVGFKRVFISIHWWIWNVAKPIHVIKKHLPIQNKANNEKSCSTPTPGKDSQSGGH